MYTYANDCTLSGTASRPQLSDSSADSDTFLAIFFFFYFYKRGAGWETTATTKQILIIWGLDN